MMDFTHSALALLDFGMSFSVSDKLWESGVLRIFQGYDLRGRRGRENSILEVWGSGETL